MEQTLLRPPSRTPMTRRERRRLAARDRLSARLAELDTIRGLFTRAAARVQVGWCQDSWTAPAGGVCLVSAIRVVGGDSAQQAVDRAVDVAWHTLHGVPDGLGLVPPPGVRLARVRDLARWNDQASRSRPEVVDLLRRAADLANHEQRRLVAALSCGDASGQTSRPGPVEVGPGLEGLVRSGD